MFESWRLLLLDSWGIEPGAAIQQLWNRHSSERRESRERLGTQSAAASHRPHLGDEVLLEERLACTEEKRVRLPPSPLSA